MATRNRKSVELCWLHMDVAHSAYDEVRAALAAVHEKSGAVLSCNMNFDGTQCLIKLLGTMPTLTAKQSEAVKRIYTDADHDEAVAMVSTFATKTDASAGWRAPTS